MTTSHEDTNQHEQDAPHEEREHDERLAQAAEEDDQTRHPTPPGNPDTDDAAVEKGEETLGRVVGR